MPTNIFKDLYSFTSERLVNDLLWMDKVQIQRNDSQKQKIVNFKSQYPGKEEECHSVSAHRRIFSSLLPDGPALGSLLQFAAQAQGAAVGQC